MSRVGVGDRRSGAIAPWTLIALGGWLAITVAWWALALWPMPGDAPEWLARARSVCFNTTDTGLPDSSGWLLLIGQPIGMLGVLYVGWAREVRGTLAGLAGRTWGRGALAGATVVIVGGLAAAGLRVTEARATTVVSIAPDPEHPARPLGTELSPGPLDLVDQNGDRATLERFRGRPVLLTFAFGHCETVCPLVVRNAEIVRGRLAELSDAVLLVVTLDPWRDTPSRLPYLARAWHLSTDGFALSGSVEEVNAVLDGWQVQRTRDLDDGDIVHVPVVYVIDREGRVAATSRGELESLTRLVERL
ncbi:MAG: SCO family protein [Gemmatimonadetes bacterium]|nr:SCO family protein [Gemmatimonadota bacterium]